MTNHLIHLCAVDVILQTKAILKNIEFTIAPREIISIIGPNGAGKSTLIKVIAGLIAPSSGRVKRPRQLKLGYMPQRLGLDPSLPMDVQRFLNLVAGTSRHERHEVLAQLEILHLANSPLHALSGGELQRVLLARTILLKPHLLLLDEPLQGVDVAGQLELYRLIANLRDVLGCAIVMVSHDLHLVMARTDTVICLNQHICCHGGVASVSQHPEYLKLFGDKHKDLAIYTHHHDHQHDLRGEIVKGVK